MGNMWSALSRSSDSAQGPERRQYGRFRLSKGHRSMACTAGLVMDISKAGAQLRLSVGCHWPEGKSRIVRFGSGAEAVDLRAVCVRRSRAGFLRTTVGVRFESVDKATARHLQQMIIRWGPQLTMIGTDGAA